MATIQLKRGSGIPTGLLDGEPAVDVGAHRLFVGGGAAAGYSLGCQSLPFIRGAYIVAGDIAGSALSTLQLTASRLYYIPFVVPRAVTLSTCYVDVTTSSAGTLSIGVYASRTTEDRPGALLAAVSNLDTGTTGLKTGSLNYPLVPGVLYWACVIASSTPTVRALPVAASSTSLGRITLSNNAANYARATGSGATLPDPAPDVSFQNGAIPAIYMVFD